MRSHLSSSHCGVRSSCQSQSIRLPHAQLGGSVGYVGPLARSTFYPCRHLGRTPYASCAVERVVANPLHQSAPSLKTVSDVLTRVGYGRLDPWCMLQTLSMTPVLLVDHLGFTKQFPPPWSTPKHSPDGRIATADPVHNAHRRTHTKGCPLNKASNPLMILVAGPYRSGTNDDPVLIARNVEAMTDTALRLFRAGHLPVLGEWFALPLIEHAGSKGIGHA